MEIIIGILLLLTFLGFACYSIKGMNLMMGLLIMSIIWTVLPLIGNQLVSNPDFIAKNAETLGITFPQAVKSVFQDGPESWGATLVNIFFGAWFGRILLETGITSTVIRKTVELGGDKPLITMTLLSIVVSIIFTSMQGAGPVIAIGVIVLPILLSLGVPKALALVTYMGAIGSGLFLNPVIFKQYAAIMALGGELDYDFHDYYRFGFVCLLVQLLVVIIMSGFRLSRAKAAHAWAARSTGNGNEKNAPAVSLICIIFPVLFVILFDLPVISGFIFASFYALFTCKKLTSFEESCTIYSRTFLDGVIDTAPLVGFFLLLPAFGKASSLCAPYFQAVLGNIMPKSPLVICLAFGLLAPFALFRGPLSFAGCGAATLGVLTSVGFAAPLLFPLMNITTITMNVSSCITQSWITWGLGYTKVSNKDFLRLSIPNGWTICVICAVLACIMII